MEENSPAAELMLACSTQWRAGGFGLIGLDYVAVYRVAESLDISMDAAMLRKICLMERLTLERWAEERDGEARGSENNGFKRRNPHRYRRQ